MAGSDDGTDAQGMAVDNRDVPTEALKSSSLLRIMQLLW